MYRKSSEMISNLLFVIIGREIICRRTKRFSHQYCHPAEDIAAE